MYRAIVSVDGKNSKVLSGETPAALGEAIGEAIATDPLGTKADVVYELSGPISRRMSTKKVVVDPDGDDPPGDNTGDDSGTTPPDENPENPENP